jgi:hypothetical protein
LFTGMQKKIINYSNGEKDKFQINGTDRIYDVNILERIGF